MSNEIYGHWIAGRDYIKKETWYVCSLCYSRVKSTEALRYKFCPFCGYPMNRREKK